jgi:DNA-directed RNA polymerase alpha subunit
MNKEELLDRLALVLLEVFPQSAQDAYLLAENLLESRQKIIDKWALREAVVFDGIEQLCLTNRCERCLKAEGIFTITQLIKRTHQDLLKTPNLGRKSLTEIILRLNDRGLKLRGQE